MLPRVIRHDRPFPFEPLRSEEHDLSDTPNFSKRPSSSAANSRPTFAVFDLLNSAV